MTQPIPQVLVKTYMAKNQEKASKAYGAEASALATQGYVPTQQIWSGPRYWRLFLTPIILMFVGWLFIGLYGIAIGALIGIVYVILFRPKGTMTVTYQQQQPAHQQPAYPQQPPTWG